MLRFARGLRKAKRLCGPAGQASLLLCFCAAILAAGTLASAEPKRPPRQPAPVLPPEPRPASATVKRGESVRILLRIYGAAHQPIRFRVKSPPAAGVVSEPEKVGGDAAAVVYKHSGKAEPERDRFTFVVQSEAGVSAPAPVDVTITDDPPILAVPDALEFGNVTPGTASERRITLENRGGGTAQGRLETGGGWSVRGPDEYRMERGETQQFTIVFTPKEEREYRAEIRYTGDMDRVTLLHGFGAEPFAVSPMKLDLTARPNERVRTGVLDLENRTNRAQQAAIEAGEKLRVSSREIEVPANGKAQVRVETAEDAEASAFDDALEIRLGEAAFRVEVRAAAAGPLLRVNAEKIALREAAVGSPSAGTLQVENSGGTPAAVRAQIDAPFQMPESDSTFTLEPGEKRLVRVVFRPTEPGRFTGLLRVTAAAQSFSIPVEAQGVEPVDATAIARTPAAPAPAVPVAPVTPAPDAPAGSRPADFSQQPLLDQSQALAIAAAQFRVHVKRVSPRAAEIEWAAKPGDEKRDFRIERRVLSLDANRDLKIDWQPVANVEITRTQDAISARLRNLEPAMLNSYRILAPAAAPGEPPEIVGEFQIWTPAPSKPPYRLLIAAGLVAILGFLAWRRFGR